MAAKYWIAINGPSVALCSVAMDEVHCRPTPEQMFGFPTLQEAREAQKLLLDSPIPECHRRMKAWMAREDVAVRKPKDPEPCTTGPTMWVSAEEDFFALT
jgi:hypothetical protein